MLATCRAVLRSTTAGSQLYRLQSTLTASSAPKCINEISPVLASLGLNHHGISSPNLKQLNDDMSELSLITSNLNLRSDISRPQEYKLPTPIHNTTLIKHTILDPLTSQKQYDLPCHTVTVTEKVTPAMDQIHPMLDPRISPVTEIETMPYLVRIRHKKMKKHKLKKFRKRMIFVHRKLTAIKNKRKEKVMVAIEKGFATSAREFDAEKYVEGHIKEAKRGAWKIDVIQRWKADKEAKNVQSENQ